MGRQDRPLDESAGPLHEMAADLRVLREKAGSPTYLKMSRATGKSRTALAEAAGGDHLPTWPTVEAYVRACAGDEPAWERRWEDVRARVKEGVAPTPAAAPVPEQDVLVPHPDAPRPGSRRLRVGVAAAAVVLAVVGAAVAATVRGGAGSPAQAAPAPAAPATATVAVTVQNKVALGADILSEDQSPAYLSYRPLPYCKRLGCAVPDTDHLSGAVLDATCTVVGDQMVNYDLQDTAVVANPGRAKSTLWYGVPTSDGRLGYLSEVYLTPDSRGGHSLPTCTG